MNIQNLTNILTEQILEGNQTHLLALLSNVSPRVLFQKLTPKMKKEMSKDFLGNPLWIVETISLDNTKNLSVFDDELDADCHYDYYCNDKDTKEVSVIECRIEGHDGNQWIYDMSKGTILRSQLLDKGNVKTFNCNAVVNIKGNYDNRMKLGELATLIKQSVSPQMYGTLVQDYTFDIVIELTK